MLHLKTIALSATLAATVAAAPLLGAASHAFADSRDFTQTNMSGISITALYVTPSDQDDWGQNALAHGPIAPGASRTIVLPSDYAPGECVFDIRVDASDGTETVTWGVNLCQGGVEMTFR